ncbi:hypothetical protein [Nonomuraea antimicrobica]|uniref:hypothetical protein n=1 Tax=Nonomuraea antimicrobica TaxID=561173 RepID=UPI0031E83C27
MTVASAALVALPFAGSALADAPRVPQTVTAAAVTTTNTAAAKAPAHSSSAKRKEAKSRQAASLKVTVDPGRVSAGSSYDVEIVAKGLSSGTATVTSPEGKTYRVALSDGQATKTLSVPSKTKTGSKTVSVKVGNKVATASFTVTAPRRK